MEKILCAANYYDDGIERVHNPINIKTGFVKTYTIPADYYWTNGRYRYHKFGFRHRYLAKKLNTYDPKLTEDQNCRNNGFWKIWDCGKTKYVLNNTSN